LNAEQIFLNFIHYIIYFQQTYYFLHSSKFFKVAFFDEEFGS